MESVGYLRIRGWTLNQGLCTVQTQSRSDLQGFLWGNLRSNFSKRLRGVLVPPRSLTSPLNFEIGFPSPLNCPVPVPVSS